jgi:hypothetical protein
MTRDEQTARGYYQCRRCGATFDTPHIRCVGRSGNIDPATDRYVPSGEEHRPEVPVYRKEARNS